MSRKLVTLPIELSAARITKFRQEDLQGQALVESVNADGFELFHAFGKLPGSEEKVLPAVSGVPWRSLHSFERINLLGVVEREALGLNGTVFYEINDNKSLTSLKTGLISEPLFDVTALGRIHLTSPINEPFKYDGNSTTVWGLVAPGEQQTVVHPINSVTGWEVGISGDTIATSPFSVDGLGSLQLNKINTSVNRSSVQTLSGSYNFSGPGGLNGFFNFFVPAGGLDVLQNSGAALDLTIGSGGGGHPLEAYNTYNFSIGELQEGRNALSFVLSSPNTTSGTVTLNDVQDIRFTLYTNTAGNTMDGFLFDKLYVTDLGRPTISGAITATGTLTQTRRYLTTFVDKYGFASNAGPPSVSVVSSGTIWDIQNIPISANSATNKRQLFRDLDNDNLYRFVAEIPDNTTTLYRDSIAVPGGEQPPFAGDLDDDNTPPPRMAALAKWNNHIFGINSQRRNQLEIMLANEPGSAPINNQLVFDEELTAIGAHAIGLVIGSADKAFLLTGNSVADFEVDEITSEVGFSGPRALVGINGAIVGWHKQGPYLWEATTLSQITPWPMGNNIKDVVEQLDPAAFPDIHIMSDRSRYRLLFFIQSEAGGRYDTIPAYGYGQIHAGVVTDRGSVNPEDIRQGYWTDVDLPSSYSALCSEPIELSTNAPEPWIGADDGNVYHINKKGVLNYAQTLASGTAPVECTITTTAFPLNPEKAGTGIAGSPRFLDMNFQASVSGTWQVELNTFNNVDGTLVTTTGFSVPIPAGDSSPRISLPIDNTWGEYATLSFTNNTLNEDGIIKSVRLHVIPQRWRGPRSS